MSAKIESAKFFACELWVERVDTFGVVLYRNQRPVNFNLHFGESHSSTVVLVSMKKNICLKIIFPNVLKSKEY